jgi:hypothetical protein
MPEVSRLLSTGPQRHRDRAYLLTWCTREPP